MKKLINIRKYCQYYYVIQPKKNGEATIECDYVYNKKTKYYYQKNYSVKTNFVRVTKQFVTVANFSIQLLLEKNLAITPNTVNHIDLAVINNIFFFVQKLFYSCIRSLNLACTPILPCMTRLQYLQNC